MGFFYRLQALEFLNDSLKLKPSSSVSWNNKGFALYALGRYEAAITCYDKAIEISPGDTTYHGNKNDALTSLNQIRK